MRVRAGQIELGEDEPSSFMFYFVCVRTIPWVHLAIIAGKVEFGACS